MKGSDVKFILKKESIMKLLDIKFIWRIRGNKRFNFGLVFHHHDGLDNYGMEFRRWRSKRTVPKYAREWLRKSGLEDFPENYWDARHWWEANRGK